MSQISRQWRWPSLIAHRGGGVLAPENTLAAFLCGQAYGFRMAEYDVKLSADDVPILLHDDDIQRTSNGMGLAGEMRFTDLLQQDFGSWHSCTYADEPIPSLHTIATYTQAHGIHSNIEIKPHPDTDARTGHQVALASARLWSQASMPPLLSSFSEIALAAARDAAPELPRALLIEGPLPNDWRVRVNRLGCMGLNLDYRYVTAELVHTLRSEDLAVTVWTVNDPALARTMLKWGCNAVVTDALNIINPTTFSDL